MLNRRLLVGLSNLQLSAVNSQIGRHSLAKQAATEAINSFKIIINYLMAYEKTIKG